MNPKPIHLGLIGTGQRLLKVIQKVLNASDQKIVVEAIYDPDPISQAAAQTVLGTPLTLCSSEDELYRI
ncbi:putative dehydrogenase [Puniceicoccus vermicola]